MIKLQSYNDDESFKPELTPLLDIIFIVLVFLLLTANVPIQSLDIAVPQTNQSQVLSASSELSLTVGILDDPAFPWALDERKFADWEAFSHALLLQQQQQPERSLILAADKQANVDALLKVLALLKHHNITTTNIIMESE